MTEWTIDNRLDLPPERIRMIARLLIEAEEMRLTAAAPLLSGFRVGAAAWCSNSRIALGANYERGAGPGRAIDDAIHAEDAVIANALTRYGRETKIELVAVSSDASRPSSPCGRCCGALETFGTPDLVAISGDVNRRASMWTLKELLPSTFTLPDPLALTGEDRSLIDAALAASALGFQHYTLPVLGACGAALRTPGGEIVSASRIDSLAFYGTSPIAGALSAAYARGMRDIQSMALVSSVGIPSPEERQFLYEAAARLGREKDLRVIMYASSSGKISIATPAELLPFAFGAADLSLDTAQLKAVGE